MEWKSVGKTPDGGDCFEVTYEDGDEGVFELTRDQSKKLDEIEACERRVQKAEETLRSEAAVYCQSSAVFASQNPDHPKVIEVRLAHEALEKAGHLRLK